MTVPLTGTVTLLFTDIEGSTALLLRLGAQYGDALEAHRSLMRGAWTAHGGVEMGTEGDSFFVAFPTAESAVAAAAQAQRDLAAAIWPDDARLRVRMGMHTGTPQVRNSDYIGMDVHRAARIAAAAHGGQVVLSETTAKLVAGRLPPSVALRGLGAHQLKDIPGREPLVQLDIKGLQTRFPPLKTLGTATSLPRPTTRIVGRDGELAELTALLTGGDVRLLTLVGVGGTGKTRLAVELARRLIESFPDGVYFVPLAAATSEHEVWTGIGEALDIPPEGRTPPGFFTHVARRSGLLVLDNLEQLRGAGAAVGQLLVEAPQVVVIATTRRLLHLTAEHVHEVPPLELPAAPTSVERERAGAIQLFVLRAQMVRPDFELTEENAADVERICRALDGVPLAIELAAARSRLLTPSALATRLGHGLELKDSAVDRPGRQRTMHATIAWSYDLLAADSQALFRRLGVFNGGVELDDIAAVLESTLADADLFDLVTDLVDCSLVKVRDSVDGEPRIMMLETVRAYALSELDAAAEMNLVRELHALHYLALTRDLARVVRGRGDQVVEVRRRFELERENVHEALRWSLGTDGPAPSSSARVALGVAICAEASPLWLKGGYVAQAMSWLQRAVEAGSADDPDLASCLSSLGWFWMMRGEAERARDLANRSVEMWRRIGDPEGLSFALSRAGVIQGHGGDLDAARRMCEEAVDLVRAAGLDAQLANALIQLCRIEYAIGDHDRSSRLVREAVEISERDDQEAATTVYRWMEACVLKELGRIDDARTELWGLIPQSVLWDSPYNLMVLAEDYGAMLSIAGDPEGAVKLLGAADAARERVGVPRDRLQAAEIAEPFAVAKAALDPEAWQAAYDAGQQRTIEDALMDAYAASRVPAAR